MTAKKFAKRGLIIYLVLIVVCLFLSGTIKTITTPKVRAVSVKTGKLTEEYSLPCSVVYRNAEKFYCNLPSDVVIAKCNVNVGDKVEKGDVLFSLRFADEDNREEQLSTAYHNAVFEKMSADMDFNALRPKENEQAYIEAYEQLRQYVLIESDAEVELARLMPDGCILPDEGYPEGADQSLKTAIDNMRDSKTYRNISQQKFDKAAKNPIRNAVWSAYTRKQEAARAVESAQKELTKFYNEKDEIKEITAPYGGYIASLPVSVGSAVSGNSLLCEITREVGPVLAADVSSCGIPPAVGSEVKIKTSLSSYSEFASTVESIEINVNRERVAYIAIPEEIFEKGISLRTLSRMDLTLKGEGETDDEYSLLPSAAVRGAAGDRYIYVISEKEKVLGGMQSYVTIYPVTVAAESDGIAAIKEPIGRKQAAYMETKELENGKDVIVESNN